MSLNDAANVFLIGLTPFHRLKLATLSGADRVSFHGLLEEPHDYDVPGMLEAAESQLTRFSGSIDAITGYIDFPISTMLPILCERYGLPAPTLESVLKCEHKYWARLEQQSVVPEAIPRFTAVDPFNRENIDLINLEYPFWLKPVKSSGSYLGFRISNRPALEHALKIMQEHIRELADPFNFVLDRCRLPDEVAGIDGNYCIAEELIGGRQCTLEGYVYRGEVHFHGTVDSIRLPNSSSFARYEYPSRIPVKVQRRMAAIATRVLEHVGYDNAGFNIEFFWDRDRDKVWLLEINTRVAQHHSDLFEKVDGMSNHEVPVKIALGQAPKMTRRKGAFRRAAAFFLRADRDALVTRIPTDSEIAEVQRRFPGTVVDLHVKEGMRLSELHEQDSYNYSLAIVYMGASNRKKLLANWEECARSLRFRFDWDVVVR